MASELEIRQNLADQYVRLRPLLEYFKARLKYDTVRWIRTFGAKDDIIFSTRIKSFDRIYQKILPKVPLSLTTDLKHLILSGEGSLDDTVGMRFVCFDPYHVIRLISHFITTERVHISKCEYYVSSRSGKNNPLHQFLDAHGFQGKNKPGREYEDVSFVIRFSHPIDLYFGSAAENFRTFDQKRGSRESDRLATVQAIFDEISHGRAADLIKDITDYPIECQIVTATQHIYNRTQRPHFEYIVQSRGGDFTQIYMDVSRLELSLNGLKSNLVAVDEASLAIFEGFGIEYKFTPAVTPGAEFGLEGRLPEGFEAITDRLKTINSSKLPKILDPGTPLQKRMEFLESSLQLFDEASREIEGRAEESKDLLARNILDISDIPELNHAGVAFWALQRIAIFEVLHLLLFANADEVPERLLGFFEEAQPRMPSTDGEENLASLQLRTRELLIRRLFERLKHMDGAVSAKLDADPDVLNNGAGIIERSAFTDPLVFWRYSTFMYRQGEYLAAQNETEIGLKLWAELEKNLSGGPKVDLPEKAQFSRRLVEYQICHEIERLRHTVVSVAGTFEGCDALGFRAPQWIAALQEVARETSDFVERARATCYILMLHLCLVSSGRLRMRLGLEAELGEPLRYYRSLSAEVEESTHANQIKITTWWHLCEAISNPARSEEELRQFNFRINEVRNHPIEKINFDHICCNLIELWTSGNPADPNRFNVNALERLGGELAQLRAADGAAQRVRLLEDILEEARAMSFPVNLIDEATRDRWRVKLDDPLVGGAGNIAVEAASTGLRVLLGL